MIPKLILAFYFYASLPSQLMSKSSAPLLQISQSNIPPSPGCLPQLVSRPKSVEIPKLSTLLKSLNWVKLSETKLVGIV